MANFSPSMNKYYSEEDLDRAADLWESGKRSAKQLHEGLAAVERDAKRAHILYHKSLIDREQDAMARRIMNEFNMADSGVGRGGL